jgi:hypothetical protein
MFVSCFPTRKLGDSQHLLVRNKVVADKKSVPVDDIRYAVRPQPNKKTLGIFPWKIGIYQSMIPNEKPYYEQFKCKTRNLLGKYPVLLDTQTNDYHATQFNKFRHWIQNSLGEPPVLLDSSYIEYSLAQVKLMMHNMGYFNATVDFKIKLREKRATIFYNITAGVPYRINEISYQMPEPMDKIIYLDTARSYVKQGDVFSAKNIENQIDRMERRVQNAGYFNFTKNYIHCDVDTNLGRHLLNLKLVVLNPLYKTGDSSLAEGKHRCFIVNAINVLYNLSPNDNLVLVDTIHYTEIVKKTNDTNNYIVFYSSDQVNDYKPSALVYPVFFSPGDVFSSRSSRNTYDRYSDMQNFNFIKISYAETMESKANFAQDTGYLDCQVLLIRSKRRSIGWELLGKYSGGIFGVGAEVSYRNKNLFKSAEILSFSLKYIQEARMNTSEVLNFQNFELGGNIRLDFPRFLFPIKQQNIPKAFRPKTWINLGSNYVKRQYYSRFLIGYVFAYEWSERKTQQRIIKHSLSVLDFNLIKMNTDKSFNDFFKGFSQRILEKYKDHFVLGTNYQIILEGARRYKFRVRFDAYGNTMYAGFRVFGNLSEKYKNGAKQYTVWGIPFASGITVDLDYTYNILQNRKSALVYHAALGIGLPTMNSSELSFEKSFYLGGANSMRGWRLRALGPGSHNDTTKLNLEKVGDIKFETNLEFRQPIYKIFHLGVFADVGNIWLMRKNEAYPNGKFAFNRFFKEIAADVGIGLRLDFSFFIVRLDYAVKIHDPARQDNTWTFKNWTNFKTFASDGAIVLGIGHAF